MNAELAEKLLSKVMGWKEAQLTKERLLLQMMARCKFDHYEQYKTGMRFIESLAMWLKQFQTKDRPAAYEYIKNRMIFISDHEMNHLASISYPYYIRMSLVEMVAKKLGISKFHVNSVAETLEFNLLKRCCLYLGLSDGAKIDVFRRANSREVGNEQVYAGYQLSDDKAADLVDNLRGDLSKIDPDSDHSVAKFQVLVLLDDFMGSGKTCLRRRAAKDSSKLSEVSDIKQKYKGRIATILSDALIPGGTLASICDMKNLTIIFMHYIATDQAMDYLSSEIQHLPLPPAISLIFQCVQPIPQTSGIGNPIDSAMAAIVDSDEYYDAEASKDPHLLVGGTTDAKRGFSACGIPLVLTHNTPNNSLFLLWSNPEDFKTRGLFPRVPRHRGEP